MNISFGAVVELVKALKAFNQNIQARLSPHVAIKHASSSTKMALIAMKLDAFIRLSDSTPNSFSGLGFICESVKEIKSWALRKTALCFLLFSL